MLYAPKRAAQALCSNMGRLLFWQYWTQWQQIKESEYFTQELSLDINYWSRFVECPFCPAVGCCMLTFEILFTKILDFFNTWVFVRISTNFAHLASFQAIEFVDWPVPKMLHILYVRQAKTKLSLQNATFCNIINYCCLRRTSRRLHSHPQFPHFSLGPPRTVPRTTNVNGMHIWLWLAL